MTLGYLNRIFCWNTILFFAQSVLSRVHVSCAWPHPTPGTNICLLSPASPGCSPACGVWSPVETLASDVVTRGNYQWSPVQPQLPVTELHSHLCSDIGQSWSCWPPGPRVTRGLQMLEPRWTISSALGWWHDPVGREQNSFTFTVFQNSMLRRIRTEHWNWVSRPRSS